MRINTIILKNYKPFSFSDISNLQIDFVSNTTIVVGTNGSGKSALFQMLNPLPPVRTDFSKDGYKEIHITHENKEYILTSDFSNKTSPHSFIVDQTELNIGGTTGVQEELVQKYFGYTNIDDKLVRVEIDICRMGRAERKNLFLMLNPTDLSLVLDIHKKTLTKLKEYKTNLTHLYRRKEELESKMLSVEILKDTKNYKNELETQKNTLDKLIYAIHQHIEQVKINYQLDNTTHIETVDYDDYFRYVRKTISTFTDIDRYEHQLEFDDMIALANHNDSAMVFIQKQIDELHNEIKEYQVHIDSNTNKPITLIEQEVLSLTGYIKGLNVDDIVGVIIPTNKLDTFLELIQSLKPKLFFLSERSHKSRIWNDVVLNKVAMKLDNLHRDTRYLSMQLNQINQDIKSAESEINKFSLHIPSDCITDQCGLKERYLTKKNSIDSTLINLYKKKKHHESRIQHLTKVSDILSQMHDARRPYTEVLYTILSTWANNWQLHDIVLAHPLIHILNVAPLSILQILEYVYENSKSFHHRQSHIEKRDILQKEIDALTKANATSKVFMENLMQDKLAKLNTLLVEFDMSKLTWEEATRRIKKILAFEGFKIQLTKDYDTFIQQSNLVIGNKTVEYYSSLITSCEAVKNDLDHELRNIDTTIKEQDALYSRYEEEIIKQIQLIETDRIRYIGIEKELSPNTGLPHKYLVSFINSLIHNTNYFIAQVFSYPLKVSKLDPNEPIDFSFEVTVGNISIKDISYLSKGQKEIMLLAWTLAILLQKNVLNNFPLFLDEIGGSFCPTHQVALLELLKSLQEQGLVNQMFMINHMSIYFDGFNNSDVIALKTDDTILTNNINTHVQIE